MKDSILHGLNVILKEIEQEREVKIEKKDALIEIMHEIQAKLEVLNMDIDSLEHRRETIYQVILETEET